MQGRGRVGMLQEFQKELDRLLLWCADSEGVINPAKLTATWFS